jgi:hypothetical protein
MRTLTHRFVILLTLVSCPTLLSAADIPSGELLTLNFSVQNLESAVARQVGEAAERFRKQIAREWLGEEMPVREDRCPIQVTIRAGRSGGVSQFNYDSGRVLSQSMRVEGSLDAVLSGVLPHEMTHIVLAHAIGRPVPRWADEGAACLAEDEISRRQREQRQRECLQAARMMPLARLFVMREYPPDVAAFYAQSCAVAKFLIARKDRPTFLAFVREGSESGWDTAAKKHYDFDDVSKMEVAWLAQLNHSR